MLSPCVPRCGSCARMLSPCVPHCGNRTVPRCGGCTRRSRRSAGRKETACQARTLGCHAAERRATRCVLRLDEADPLGGKAPAGHVRRAGVVGEVQIKRQRLEKTSRKTLLSVGAVTSQQKKGGLVARHEPTRSSAEEGKGPGRWPTSSATTFGSGKNVVLPFSSAREERHRSFWCGRPSAQPTAGRPSVARPSGSGTP